MKPLRILIVEDDIDHAEGLADVMEMKGHGVVIAYTGEEAIAAFAKGRFDLIFMDVKLPGIDGVEVFLKMREVDRDAKVVIMSGYSKNDLLIKASDHGAVKVFRKPYRIEEFLEIVQSVAYENLHDSRE